MYDQRLRLVRTELRTVLDRVRRRLDPETEVYLRHPMSREDFALCLNELLDELDGENWSGILLRHYPVGYIVKLDTVMDRVPRWEDAHASPQKWGEGAGPTDPSNATDPSRLKYHEPIRPETVRILRKSLGILYSNRIELALDQLLDRLEERFDPEWFSSCREYNEHTEFVLCLETVVDVLYDSDARVPALLLDRIHEFARIMEISDQGQNDLRSF